MPVLNNLHLTKAAVQTIFDNTYNDFELIIIDDNSIDNTWNYLEHLQKTFPNKVKIIHNNITEGVTYSWNRGIEMAGMDNPICIVNNDILVDKNWDVHLTDALKEGNSIASPYHINTLNERQLFVVGIPKFESIMEWHTNGGFPILGACFMCRENLFKDIGLFPEQLKYWYQDQWIVDMCIKNNYKMTHCSDSHIIHLYSQSISRVPDFGTKAAIDREEYSKIKK